MPELLDWVIFLAIGVAAGYLAGLIMKGSPFGLIGNLIVGVIGALIGGFVLRNIGLPLSGILGSLVSATIGAVLLLFLLQFVPKK